MKKVNLMLIAFITLLSAFSTGANAQTMTINNGTNCDLYIYPVANDACDIALSGPFLVPANTINVTIVSWASTTAWEDIWGNVLTTGIPAW